MERLRVEVRYLDLLAKTEIVPLTDNQILEISEKESRRVEPFLAELNAAGAYLDVTAAKGAVVGVPTLRGCPDPLWNRVCDYLERR